MNNAEHLESYKQEKGIPPEQCYERAAEIIERNGVCLFLFDLVGSSSLKEADRERVFGRYAQLLQELNDKLEAYLPETTLVNGVDARKGFHFALGDGAIGAINHPEAVGKILAISEEQYRDVPLRYGVAEDGWDRDAIRLIK